MFRDFGTIDIIPDLFLGRVNGTPSGTDTAEGVVNTDRAYLIPDDDTVSLKVLGRYLRNGTARQRRWETGFLRVYGHFAHWQSTRARFHNLTYSYQTISSCLFLCVQQGGRLRGRPAPFFIYKNES